MTGFRTRTLRLTRECGRMLAPASLLLAIAAPLAAQCPDGSPPPCGSSGRVSPARPAPNPDVVVVLPFRVIGEGAEVALLRDGMADLVYISLDGLAGWRFVEPGTVAARFGNQPEPTGIRNTARFARELGAGTLITGTAVSLGTEVRLHAELYDAISLERRASVQLQGDPTHIVALVDSLAWSLARVRLSQHPAEVRRSLQEYTTSSLPALRAYLVGERLARESRWREAMDSLRRATTLDSLFGLAWYSRYRVALWGGLPGVGEDSQQVMISKGLMSSQLGPRQRDLLLAIDALHRGTRGAALEGARVLAERYPNDPDAALARGEILYHVGLPAGVPAQDALAAFETMIALDPRAVEGYSHAIELLCQIGEPDSAFRLLLVAPGRPSSFKQWEIAIRAAFRGESVNTLTSGPDSVIAREVLAGAGFRALRILNNDPARAVILADSFFSAWLRFHNRTPRSGERYQLLLAGGRFHDAWQMLSAELTEHPESERQIPTAYAANPVMFPGPEVPLRRQIADTLMRGNLFWAIWIIHGWWSAIDGDTLAVDSAFRELTTGDGWPPIGYREATGRGLQGLARLSIGDTVGARVLLEAALKTRYYQMGLAWGPLVPTVAFALQLARLDLAKGDLDQARRRLADGLYHLDEELPYRAEALELLGQISLRRGDTAAARQSYRAFVSLWEHADPELQPRVVAARDALRRLE